MRVVVGWLLPGRINTTVSIKQLAVRIIVDLLEEIREGDVDRRQQLLPGVHHGSGGGGRLP